MNTQMNEPRTDQHEPGTPPPGATGGWRHTPLSRMPKGGHDGGKVGGVVAGLSRAYGFDLRTTRIATVVAMVILPVLLLVYLAAWVLLPETPAQAQPIEAVLRDRRRLPVLIVIGLVLVVGGIGSLGSWFLFRGAPWGLVLIALGVLLWVSSSHRHDPPPPPTSPFSDTTRGGTTGSDTTGTPVMGTPVTGSAFPPPTTTSAATGSAAATSGLTASATQPRVATPRRPRWPITSIGVGIAALWLVGAALFEALGWLQPEALWMIVTALGIVLVAMLISIIVNRSWVLPFLFVPLAGALVMLSVAQPTLDGASGQRTVQPTTVALAETPQRLAAGQLTVDLRDVPLQGDVTVTAEVGMGQLRLFVPSDADIEVRTSVGAGDVRLDGAEIVNGVRQHDTRVVAAERSPAAGRFVLNLTVGMGQITLDRVASNL
jgi:phage shock protein PspC (stress-responsive transcriptional regulator)